MMPPMTLMKPRPGWENWLPDLINAWQRVEKDEIHHPKYTGRQHQNQTRLY